jgi:glycogen(starch) synthase
MRLLLWTEAFWPSIGGLETLAGALALALGERGHQILVVTNHHRPGLSATEAYRGIAIHRFPFSAVLMAGEAGSVGGLGEVRQGIAELKRRFAPDLIHLQMPPISLSWFFHLVTLAASPAPWVATLHGSVATYKTGPDTLLRRSLGGAGWVSAISAAVLAEARQLVPEISARSSVIHNAEPAPAVDPSDPPDGAACVLGVGRLARDKGFDLALQAFASVRPRVPWARFVVAGGGPDHDGLRRLAARLDLDGVVELPGWVSPEEVPSLMRAATVVVVPSRDEGFGMVALEAALMARPVVAFRVGGLPEVVAHGETGFLVEPEDPLALAERIVFLLEHGDAAREMGRRARLRALEVFDWERCVNAYESLYRKLVQEQKLGHRED